MELSQMMDDQTFSRHLNRLVADAGATGVCAAVCYHGEILSAGGGRLRIDFEESPAHDALFPIFSISKTMVAAAALLLETRWTIVKR